MTETADSFSKTRQGEKRSKLSLMGRLGLYAARAILPVLIIMVAIGGYRYMKATKPEFKKRTAQEKTWPVITQKITFSDFTPVLKLYGETIAGRKVELRSLVAGEIKTVGKNLREGGSVNKGEILLELDPFHFEGAVTDAQARLDEAEAKLQEIIATIALERDGLKRAEEQLKLAQKDLARAIPLARKGTVTQKLADDRRLVVSQRQQSAEKSRNNLIVQQARADQQKATIARLGWSVRQAKRNLENTVLRAPYNAYISALNAEIGRYISVNDRVATLFDRDRIDVRFTLSDQQYGRITAAEGDLIGRAIEVIWHVGGAPIKYQGQIDRVSAEISSETGGVALLGRIDYSSQQRMAGENKPKASHANKATIANIRTGAFVEIRLKDRTYNQVARVPQTAIYNGDLVYVVEQQRLVPRRVEIIGAVERTVLIRGALKAGEKIITTRLTKAGKGVRVFELKDQAQETPSPDLQKPDGTAQKGVLKNNKDKSAGARDKNHNQNTAAIPSKSDMPVTER